MLFDFLCLWSFSDFLYHLSWKTFFYFYFSTLSKVSHWHWSQLKECLQPYCIWSLRELALYIKLDFNCVVSWTCYLSDTGTAHCLIVNECSFSGQLVVRRGNNDGLLAISSVRYPSSSGQRALCFSEIWSNRSIEHQQIVQLFIYWTSFPAASPILETTGWTRSATAYNEYKCKISEAKF